MHKRTIYITYDLPQAAEGSQIVRGVKHVEISGELIRQEVGEFPIEARQAVPGVRLTYALETEEDVEREVIELPKNAQNVQVHVDQLPEAYRPALDEAA